MDPDFQPLVRNPHALTILGNYWPRKIDAARFPAKRVEYRIDDSTRIVVLEHQPQGSRRADILFVHGLEGSAEAGYIRSFAQNALLNGFGVHRMNLRTCGGTEELCETMYHSGLTSDTREISQRIRLRSNGPFFLVGFSLGGNVVLKLAGELGYSELLTGVCAISTPIDLASCVRSLDRPVNFFYARRFLQRLCDRVRRKSKLAPHLYSEAGLRAVKTIWEFDDRFTAPLFGFGTAANYYATQSATGYLNNIRVPTLVIAAKDDPLVPFAIYNHPAFRTNPALTLIAPEHGGHLGFLSRNKPRFWVDTVALHWMECLLGGAKTKRNNGSTSCVRVKVSVSVKRNYRPSASFWEAGRIAIDSLNKNKLRSFLTLLGIILATTTLISVTALIHGMNLYIATKVSNMGSDGFRIVRMAWFGPPDPKKLLLMSKRNPNLKHEEYDFINEHATLLRGLGITASTTGRVSFRGQSTDNTVSIQGITANIPALNNVQVDEGRGITDEEVHRHGNVAFIGHDITNRFFENRDPIGKTIEVDGIPFEVVGAAKELGSVFGQSQDNFVMIPIDTYFKTYGAQKGMSFVAKAVDQEHLFQAEDEVTMLLRAFRHLRPGQDNNFGIISSDSFVSLWQRLTAAIAATAVGIVSVFMVVGGIVIMNIMLAAVTERTHEIGIRKSLGARRTDIMNQFLVESATLAATGGLVGVIVAWGIAAIIRNAASIPMALPVTSVLIGVGLSAIVGLFFGIYPARQASKLDPIEALRSEM